MIPAVMELRKTQALVIEAQWKALVESLREASSLDNCIAICDVSGSMGYIGAEYNKNNVYPILPGISLSLIFAALGKPHFNAGFITFAAQSQLVQVDLTQSPDKQVILIDQVGADANTDFRAVFLDFRCEEQSQTRRYDFVFSDMQFDSWQEILDKPLIPWETTYDVIERAYEKAGYQVPQIVFWDLYASGKPKTVEVESDRKGVAMMNGFSPALLKVFIGEEEWEDADEFTPINLMKKTLLRKSFDGLVVVVNIWKCTRMQSVRCPR